MPANDTVLLARDGAIAMLTLNRPAALNALDFAMIEALNAHASEVAADDSVRVVVIEGAGKHFMAGGDIRLFAQSLEQPADARAAAFQRLAEDVHAAIETLARMPHPIVAKLRGAVAGFGFSLANACDLAFAAEDAYFASAYLQLGVTPDGGGTYWLPRIVGSRKACEIMLLGERIDARTAASIGIVNRTVPADALDEVVHGAARRIAEGPALAARGLKRLLRASPGRSLSEQLQAEAVSFGRCAGSSDFAEGVRSFLEKRAPRFGGQ
jgi:2-(1,2-epoxy-1,2-dihydrophenyl)acetyl-CoA isomerase